jgi:hypothetical protein
MVAVDLGVGREIRVLVNEKNSDSEALSVLS